jgi:GDP/UDP-N,N'-diacetylbacillosamine 2-epimerase (hydrolysing)
MKKKICIVTGTRAEYGLFRPLLWKIKSENRLKLQIIATGMHLSREFGWTYKEIEKDGFKIDEKVKILLSGDTEVSITKSLGSGVIGFADAFNRLKPDLVILLGDRFETFSAAIASFVARIPIAHLYGGELTKGSMDDAFRHSITKMSYLHFTATEEYRKRVIQLGESPDRVFNVGAIGIDNIKNLKLLGRKALERQLNFIFGQKNILVTFHPSTLEDNTAEFQTKELLKVLDDFRNVKIIFTKPNADVGSRIIPGLIDEYVAKNSGRCKSFISLGTLKYLSAMKVVDLVAGNSSSGIIEMPSFGKPTVNIGERQKDRIRAKSVIDCKPEAEDIKKAMNKAFSKRFQRLCGNVCNPYGKGRSAEKIYTIIKRNIDHIYSTKKDFFDIPANRCIYK